MSAMTKQKFLAALAQCTPPFWVTVDRSSIPLQSTRLIRIQAAKVPLSLTQIGGTKFYVGAAARNAVNAAAKADKYRRWADEYVLDEIRKLLALNAVKLADASEEKLDGMDSRALGLLLVSLRTAAKTAKET